MNKLRKLVAAAVLSTSVIASAAPVVTFAAEAKVPGPIKPTVAVAGDPSQWGLKDDDVSLTRKVNEYEGQH